MALPSDGPMSASKINIELGRGGTAEFQFSRAEGGAYGALNTSSPAKPDGKKPHALSEWYRYDHGAVSCAPSGTYLSSYCDGCTLYYVYANGSCGSYAVSQGISTTCGTCCGAPAAGQFVSSTCEECTEITFYTDGCYGTYSEEVRDSPTCCPPCDVVLWGPFPSGDIPCYDPEYPVENVIQVWLYDQEVSASICCADYNGQSQVYAYQDSGFRELYSIGDWWYSPDCGTSYWFNDGRIQEYFVC